MMHVLVSLRKFLNVEVGKNINEVKLKRQFIKNNLYGVDIDPGAIEIAKLRLWLSLIVDYEKSEAEPLPNLDFQFRVGNSLQEKIAGFDVITDEQLITKKRVFEKHEQLEIIPSNKAKQVDMDFYVSTSSKILKKMQKIIDGYFEEENEDRKKNLKNEFDTLEKEIFEARINDLKKDAESVKKLAGNDPKRLESFKQRMEELDKLTKTVKYGAHKLFIPLVFEFFFSPNCILQKYF